MLFRLTIFLTCQIFISIHLFAQVRIGGVVNEYYEVLSVSNDCPDVLIETNHSISEGDLCLIIQMQGAEIIESNNENYGNILTYSNAGNYEFARAVHIDQNQITFSSRLSKNYTPSDRIQLIKVAEFDEIIIESEITCLPWNGRKGGVIAIVSKGDILLEADINAGSDGFTGGGMVSFYSVMADHCRETDFVASYNDNVGAQKGEGIAGFKENMEYARGKQANGGGGGNIHNAGGGGGSNYGKGGLGGKEWVRCGAPVLSIGGVGGSPLNYDSFLSARVFMGGGGGGGNENDDGGTKGANGGGIILLKANQIIATKDVSIKAKGGDVIDLGVLDSGGGGGGGGSIFIESNQISGPIFIDISGGFGGRINEPFVNGNFVWGPGGGGGGGVFAHNLTTIPSNIIVDVNGGDEGFYVCCPNWTWDAEPGGDGGVINTLSFDIDPWEVEILEVQICENASYQWNDQIFTEPGEYKKTIKNSQGCDSTIIMNLIVNPVYETNLEAKICEGDEYLFEGQILTEADTYTEVLQSEFGCDSTIILNLIVHPVYETNLEAVICEGDEYVFDGQILTEAGTYTEVIQSEFGCDSIILNLMVQPVYEMNLEAEICEGDEYLFEGQILTEAGTYTEVLQNEFGCDSTIIMNLLVNPVYETNLEVQICENESYHWNDQIFTEPGEYKITVKNSEECDSVYYITVEQLEIFHQYHVAQACEGESFYFNDNWYFESGSYTDTIISTDECDTILYLDLIFNPTASNDLFFTLCHGDTLNYNGTIITETTFYLDTLFTAFGCDSIVSIAVTLLPETEFNEHTLTTCKSISIDYSDYCPYVVEWRDSLNGNITHFSNTFTIDSLLHDTLLFGVCIENDCIVRVDQFNIVYELVNEEFQINLPNSYSFCDQEIVNINLPGYMDYLWSTGQTEHEIFLDTFGEYSLFAVDIDGCAHFHPFKILPCLSGNWYVPNAFSPNGDGINDVFRMYGPKTESYQLRIYDRWGSLLFESNDFNTGWDGTFKGILLNSGVYIYTIEFEYFVLNGLSMETETKVLSGDVLLYR